MAPPGLTALGAKGSVRDRLTPPGRFEGSALGSYEVSLRWGGMAPLAAKTIQPGFAREKTIQLPCGRWKCIPPLVAGATTFPPRWEACHWILSLLRLPTNPVPLPPQAGALWVLSNGAMFLQESIERFILSPGWGGKGTRFVREQSDLRIV